MKWEDYMGPGTLSVADIKDCVELVRLASDDPERAHMMEDELHLKVLSVFALGWYKSDDECLDLADAALGTTSIDFPRWCA